VLRRFDWALVLTLLILIECGVLALNRGRCPLTDVAAKFTDKRADNFDIYLPNWLARHNKAIFGTIFVANELIVFGCWLGESVSVLRVLGCVKRLTPGPLRGSTLL